MGTSICPSKALGIAAALVLTGSVLGQTGNLVNMGPGQPPAVGFAPAEGQVLAGAGPALVPVPDDDVSGAEFWATGDYMVGWIRGAHLPPLVSTSPAGTPQATAGVLGAATTSIVVGNQTVADDARSGGRFQIGIRSTGPTPVGIEAGFYFLQSQSTTFAAQSNGATILARPFLDALTGTPNAVQIAFPGVRTGGIVVDAPSDGFYSVNVDLSKRFYAADSLWFEGLIGWRFLQFGDELNVAQSISPLNAPFVPGTQIFAGDHFKALNQFNGLELGLRTAYVFNQFSIDALGKIAGGNVFQAIDVNGNTIVAVPGAATTSSAGGVLALPTNSGNRVNKDTWGVVTELGTNAGWQVRPHLRLRMGYTFLFWQNIQRAADQVDLQVNSSQFPPGALTGARRPVIPREKTDLFVQSINFGAEFRY